MSSDKKKEYCLFRIWDVFVLVLVLALLAVTLYFVISPKRGQMAEVYRDGELIRTLSLDVDTEIILEDLTIVVEDGSIFVKYADCPDKICERRGRIYNAGESIICLPNKIIIKVVGKGEVEAIT